MSQHTNRLDLRGPCVNLTQIPGLVLVPGRSISGGQSSASQLMVLLVWGLVHPSSHRVLSLCTMVISAEGQALSYNNAIT